VLQPGTDQALSAFMHWWQTSHARRYHLHYGSHGHLWQGRYKSFPIQQDAHLLTVLRYVLRNPLRAGLVQRSADWPWSSHAHPTVIDPWPIDVPPNWSEWVDAPQFDHELARLRTCVTRQAPFGTPAWQEQTAKALGLDSTLRPPGRPRKTPRENGA